jgi:hypothetical protein
MVEASQVFGRASGKSQWYNVTNGSMPLASNASLEYFQKKKKKELLSVMDTLRRYSA